MYSSADIGSVEQRIGRSAECMNAFVRFEVQGYVMCCCGASREGFQHDRGKCVIKVAQANERPVDKDLKQIVHDAKDRINMHRKSHMQVSTHF